MPMNSVEEEHGTFLITQVGPRLEKLMFHRGDFWLGKKRTEGRKALFFFVFLMLLFFLVRS